MHYYKRNIGDYAKKAGRLSLLQHGVYCQLIDACYDREAFPTMAEAVDWVWASTPEEEAAVHFVLRRFFTLEGDKYVQNEIREDIAAYHERSTINKRIANQKQRTVNESSTNRQRIDGVDERNHKPLTINQEPLTKNQEKDKPPASRSASKKTLMPADFAVSDRVRAWALENKHGQLEQHLTAFCLACQAKGYAYADWDAAFMNAIRNNWAKLAPTLQQLAAVPRKPDRFDLADLEYEKKYGTPESVKSLVAKFTGAAA